MSLVGVRITPAGRVHYLDPGDLDLEVDDRVLFEFENGTREGQVVIAPSQVIHSDLRGPMSRVLKKIPVGGEEQPESGGGDPSTSSG